MFQIIKNLKRKGLHPFIWIYLPILIPLIFLLVKKININLFVIFFQGENGIIENGTFVILFIAIIISILSLIKFNNKFKKRKILFFVILFILGLTYFAGEEISWGQHWFHWEANQFFQTYNDQQFGNSSETNFHNISSWFDQKPKLLLILFVLFGGILYPLYFSNNNTNDIKYWVFPSIHCFPTSLIFLFFYFLDNSYKILCSGTPGIDINCNYIPTILYFRTSEIIELYLALFLLIYILSINARLQKN